MCVFIYECSARWLWILRAETWTRPPFSPTLLRWLLSRPPTAAHFFHSCKEACQMYLRRVLYRHVSLHVLQPVLRFLHCDSLLWDSAGRSGPEAFIECSPPDTSNIQLTFLMCWHQLTWFMFRILKLWSFSFCNAHIYSYLSTQLLQ
jgi:hypothetical protein